ncbi:MAG: hypothetical protein L0Y75_06915 [Acidobacteria bacterium]|nr:hypothetical protein [Acidobacteriota bacterium]
MRVRSGETLVSVDMDKMKDKERRTFLSAATKTSDLEYFDGRVQHGYSLSEARDESKCPRCKAATEQKYANFIYIVGDESRAMLGPAGYFCSKCPTVIVDEDMIKQATRGKGEFRGVVGLTDEEGEAEQYFRSWNGFKTIFDGDLGYSGRGAITFSPRKHQKMMRKKRLAKESRKRNRRR